jgi:DNA polymerase-1
MLKATRQDAYDLIHQGVIALSQVESNGIKIDVDYLNQAMKDITVEIKEKSELLKEDKVYKTWRKRFGNNLNLNSGDQLGLILFDVMGYESPGRTGSGKHKTDEATLESVDIDFVKKLLEIKKLKKAKSTYLKGIEREVCNGYLHPVFNMHIADTYRSTSDSPNFQNIPIRLPWMAKLIRQCFIPRAPNRHIVEADYGGIEVHGAAWYHKDPTMLDYLNDKSKDMHRDMAQQCFALPKREMINPVDKKDSKRIKNIRFCGKNMFVFPEFYGDWWYSCAPSLWSAIDQNNLHTRKGLSLKEHLASKGINTLGVLDMKAKQSPNSFMNHIREVEAHFWNKRFKVYKSWKEEWYGDYLQKGYFDTLTGFRIEGPLARNKVINYPVQGVAFHCLLWSLIRLQSLLRKYRMKSLIIGQIHDSIVADVVDKELKTYMELIQQVMVEDIKKHWKFIITPIEVEIEMAPAGKSWYSKEKVA